MPLPLPDDLYLPVGVIIEAIFFGAYTILFITACLIWRRRRTQRRGGSSFSAMVYLIFIVAMWIVACLHLAVAIHRLFRVFILEPQSPHAYLRLSDATKWDTLMHMILLSAMVWLADVLVLYRTYIVWNKNIWVLAFPIIVHLAYMALSTLGIYLFSHPWLISQKAAYDWYRPVFPLVLLQNVLTTALLSYKIWAQHCESSAAGVVHTGGARSLGSIARILIESAMLYTLELLVIIVLGAISHPATETVSSFLVPTAGIVFVLLSVRVHFGGPQEKQNPTLSNLPDWLLEAAERDNIELARNPNANDRFGRTPDRLDVPIGQDGVNLKFHHESSESEHDHVPFSNTLILSRKDSTTRD